MKGELFLLKHLTSALVNELPFQWLLPLQSATCYNIYPI